ncbi:DUF4249 family protein [Zobellia uliginosa]|uniref:DUF4249 family protein n=1 Tax=Zobellia uliginosa TaxID=143224 RepID=UPI001C068413|nr:DUF4249 family protein [Zobellia uliginosa]MBU2946905.1 DUF4249 domain-containing protein [Zobellia uliginosa]
MNKYLQISLLFVLLCSACQDPVDPDELLNIDDRTYIVGYLSPSDTLLSVHVSTAVPAIGTQIDSNDPMADIEKFIIKDALVIISDEEDNQVQLIYNAERRNYQAPASEFDIIEGNTYFLKVSTDDKEYTSSCTIPQKVDSITEVITPEYEDEYSLKYILDIAFQDIIGKDNFYLIGGKIETEEQGQPYEWPLNFELDSFLTDAIGDGEILSQNSFFSFWQPEEGITAKITLQVTNVEENLYLNRRAAFLNDYNDGNPFVEYSIAANNIEGENAVGVFAGYQLTEKVIEYEIKK